MLKNVLASSTISLLVLSSSACAVNCLCVWPVVVAAPVVVIVVAVAYVCTRLTLAMLMPRNNNSSSKVGCEKFEPSFVLNESASFR